MGRQKRSGSGMPKKKPRQPDPALPRARPWVQWVPLGLVAAGAFAYHDSFRGAFVFDDMYGIVNNQTIRQLSWGVLHPPARSAVTGRPVANLSLALNYAMGGLDVTTYHVTNLVIHLLTALVLYGVVRRTLLLPRLRSRYGAQAPWLAGAIALVWVVHPLVSESVLYVIQRTEVLMGLFFVLTLYCTIRAVDAPRWREWYAAAIAAFVLGMGSKEVMMAAVVVLPLYDRLLLSNSFREVLRRRGLLYATLAVIAVAYLAGGRVSAALPRLGSGRVTPWSYLKTQAGVLVHYLRLSVWPHPLAADYGDWPVAGPLVSVLPSALAITGLVGATCWGVFRARPVALLGVWFFAILAPTSSVWPIASEIAGERRMYLPLVAVVSAVVLAGEAILRRLLPADHRRRTVAGVLVGAVATILATLTVSRAADYRTPTAFWTAIVATRPNNTRARINLGDILFKGGQPDAAREQFAEAARLGPDNPMARYGYGVTLAQAKRLDEAVAEYREAIRLKPEYPEAHRSLARILLEQGKGEEALEHYRAAVQGDPQNGLAHFNVGITLMRLGRSAEAVPYLETATKLKPDYAAARDALATARREAGPAQP